MGDEKVDYRKDGEVAIRAAGVTLENLALRHSKAKAYFDKLIQRSEIGVDQNTYNLIIAELKRYVQTKKTFNQERTPITEVLNAMAQPFIELENAFDKKKEGSMAFTLLKIADEYATKKANEEKSMGSRLGKQKARTIEMDRIKTEANLFLKSTLISAQEAICLEIDTLLNTLSLENLDIIKKQIEELDFTVPPMLFAGFSEKVEVFTLNMDEVVALFNDEKKKQDYKSLIIGFSDGLVQYQYDGLGKIPAIEAELKSIEDALPEDQESLVQERDIRIESDTQTTKDRFEDEKGSVKTELKEKTELVKIQGEFELGAEQAVVVNSGVKKNEKYKIKLTYPSGIAEVCKFWLEYGRPTEEKKANSMTVGRMILFAERQMNNNGYKIESQYVKYEKEVKAKI